LYKIFLIVVIIGFFSVIPSVVAESNQICIDKVWIENSKGKIACVTPSTAEKLVQRGWGTLLENIPMEKESLTGLEKELTLLSEHDGGTGPLTITPIIGETTKQYSEFYVPGTEELDENEMRIFACGTGSPWVMLGQAASCFLLQTADGHNLIFDLGGGSVGNLNTLGVPGNEMTHVFASHLHVDHIGGLPTFWGQAFMMGRSAPIELYGPSGPDDHLGTTAFVEGFMKNWAWDLESKRGEAPKSVHQINIHEFDYSVTQIVYEEDGLTVTSFPAVHAIDGPVSYRIDWNGMSVIYSGDTTLNDFLLENSMNVDVLILQVSPSAEQMSRLFGFSPELATKLTSHVHIAPDAAGVAFHVTQPRLPVIFHMNLFDTEIVPDAYTNIREYYEGPVVIAQDRTVINVTPDYAIIRQAQVDPLTTPSFTPFGEIDEEKQYFLSDWLEESIVDVEQLKKKIDSKKE
jgi:ribonuclease Z